MKHIVSLTLLATLALPAQAQDRLAVEASGFVAATSFQEAAQERKGPAQERIKRSGNQERSGSGGDQERPTPAPTPKPQPAPKPVGDALTLAKVRTVFANADIDKSNTVTVTEALRAGVTRTDFNAFDIDGNGSVTRDEFVVGMRKRAARLKQAVAGDLTSEANRIETLRKTRAADEARRQAERARKAREDAAQQGDGPAARRGAGQRRPAPAARGNDQGKRPGVRPTPRPAPKPAPSQRKGTSGQRRGGSARG